MRSKFSLRNGTWVSRSQGVQAQGTCCHENGHEKSLPVVNVGVKHLRCIWISGNRNRKILCRLTIYLTGPRCLHTFNTHCIFVFLITSCSTCDKTGWQSKTKSNKLYSLWICCCAEMYSKNAYFPSIAYQSNDFIPCPRLSTIACGCGLFGVLHCWRID